MRGRHPATSGSPCDQHEKAPPPSSFAHRNAGTSSVHPSCFRSHFELRIPLSRVRCIRRDDRQEFWFRRTYYVNWPPLDIESKHQATVASNILRVVFNDLTTQHHPSNVRARNHSIGSRHLPDGVGEEENFLTSGFRDRAPKGLCDVVLRHFSQENFYRLFRQSFQDRTLTKPRSSARPRHARPSAGTAAPGTGTSASYDRTLAGASSSRADRAHAPDPSRR